MPGIGATLESSPRSHYFMILSSVKVLYSTKRPE